jgi:hypothetical protein
MSMYTLPVSLQQAPPSPHGSIYATLPNASPAGGLMYISGSPAMTGGTLPPQSAPGQVYVQQPQQYHIQQQPQPQMMHQATTQYVPYAQSGPSPLVPVMPLQPSPQNVACVSIGDPIVSQGSNLISLSTDQLPAQLAPVQQYAVHPFLGQRSSEFWEVFRPVAPILNKMYNAVNLPATQPYQPEMRLVSADLPWTISVKATNGQYVTVGEVYETIFNALQGVVTHPEYRLTEVRTRKKMADQYQKRCTHYPLEHNEHTRGIKRVDYLLHKNVFGGLKRDDKLAEELMMLNDQKMQYTWVLTFMSR